MQIFQQALRKAAFLKRSCIILFSMCAGLLFACPSVAQTNAGDTIKVTLKVSHASLRQVLRQIEKQTGLTFASSSSVLETSRTLSIQAQQQPLNSVLRQVLARTGYTFEIRNKQILVYPSEQAPATPGLVHHPTDLLPEKYIVSGIVTDGERPLAGVSIREKDTHNGASTDGNGRFELTIAGASALLQFSLIGYEAQEIAVRGRHTISPVLQNDTRMLNDLVIIGYGIQNKANITGAIAKVEGRRIKSRPVPSVIAALQGAAPGLLVTRNNGQPGKEGFNIQIRGLSSGNNSEPLVLVDGAPSSLALLNPNDIESVSILKDAAATSIYGPQAGGGVVLVSTRRGKNGPLTVEYNSLFGVEKPINLPKRLHSWDQATLQNEAAVNAGQPPVWSAEDIARMHSPDDNYELQPDGSYKYFYDFDPLKNVTRNNSTVNSFNVSTRGGTAGHQFMFSIGQFSRQGLFNVGPDNTSRTNVQANFNNRLSSVFSIETSLQYAANHTLSPGWRVDGQGGLLNYLYQAPGNVPVYVPGTSQYAAGYNPYALLKDAGRRDEHTSFADAVFTLKADSLIKNLSLKAVYSPQMNDYEDRLGKQTVDFYDGTGIVNSVNNPNSLHHGHLLEWQHSLQLLADYDLHSLHLLGGYAYESHYQHQQETSAFNVSPNEMAGLTFNDYLAADNRHFKASGAMQSLFARANYNYKDRYLLEGNLVATSLFYNNTTLAPMRRLHLFPSVSAGWRLNNEKWFAAALPLFDEFKLRASWGRLGNFNWRTGLNDFIYRDQLLHLAEYPIMNFDHDERYFPGNNNWETISTTNFGLDMAFFKGRLNVNADYFIKHNPMMKIGLQELNPANLMQPSFFNATLHSQGWELNLGWRDNHGPFSYWVNANIFDDQNHIEHSSANNLWLDGNNRGLNGLPYNAILGYRTNGYFQSQAEVYSHAYQNGATGPGDLKYQDINHDGIIDGGYHTQASHGDLVYLGSSQPRYSFGFDGGFSWRGLDFSIFFQGIGEKKVMIPVKYNMPFYDGWQEPWAISADRWTPDNPNAAYPRLYLNDRQNTTASSFWLQNAAYVRLKNLQLGYTFHFATYRPLLKSLRIYFSGQDLWELNKMKIKYYDPEQSSYSGFQYPFFRSFTLGVNANF
jgi:TonB-linked SusC/RagA family outer membrane protein